VGASEGKVGSAYIEVGPQLSKSFTSKLQSDVQAAMRPLDTAGKNLGSGLRTANNELATAFRSAQQVRGALDSAGTSARGLSVASANLDRAAASGARLRTALDQGNGSLAQTRAKIAETAAGYDALLKRVQPLPGEISKIARETAAAEAATQKLGSTGATAVSNITRQVAGLVAAYAGVNFLRGAISDASDLAESTSKAENVFKSATQTVKEFAETSAEGFGIAKKDALEMGSTFGNLLTSMGLTRQASADMSVSLLKLAADFASFNNVSIDDALQSIRSGLVGEFESLRRFGVTLNADAIALKAVELGLAQNVRQVSAAAKIQATYNLIMEQSKNAQGDFARTADGLANSQRILTAEWSQAKATIGEGLLPTFLEIIQVAKELIPQAVELGQAFGGVLATGIQGTLPTARLFLSALTALAPVLEAIPEPLITIVANLVLFQKVLGTLNLNDVFTKPLRNLATTLSTNATGALDGLGDRMKAAAAKEAAKVATASTGPGSLFGGPLTDMFTKARLPIAKAADQTFEGVGAKINRRIQAELSDRGSGRIEGPLTAMFVRSKAPIQQAATGALDGLGVTVQKKLVTEYQRASPEEAIKIIGARMKAAQASAAAAATAVSSAATTGAVKTTLNETATAASAAAASTERLAASSKAIGNAAGVSKLGQAAVATRQFGQAVSAVSDVALPALGVALGVGAAALGIWQQKRAEAAAAQREFTAAMLADAKAIQASGKSTSEATRESFGASTRALIDQQLQEKDRFKVLDATTKAVNDGRNAYELMTKAIDQTIESGEKNNQVAQEFRKLLLDSGQIKLVDPRGQTDMAKAREEFIRTGETISRNEVITGKAKGVLDQFNASQNRAAEGAKSVNAQLSETGAAAASAGAAASSLKPLQETVEGTRDALDDATKKADAFADAIRRLGGPAIDAVTAEEDRQLAVNRALESATPDLPTEEDLKAATDKAADAATKRAESAAKLAEAQASGSESDQAKALASLHAAEAAEKRANEALTKLQEESAKGPLTAEDVIFGTDEESIGVRRDFRKVVDETLNQAALVAKTQGGEAGKNFWDETIKATKDRVRNEVGPEMEAVLDSEISRRGITDGRSILLKVAEDPQGPPLSRELATALDAPTLQKKLIETTVAAKGDIPDDVQDLLKARFDPEQRIQIAADIIAQLDPNSTVDPALFSGLNEEQLKQLTLQVAVEPGGGNKLLPDNVLLPLLTDKQFTSDLLISLKAADVPIDESTTAGKAISDAVKGTPLELLLNPKLAEGDAEKSAQLLILLDKVEEAKRGIANTPLATGPAVSEGFFGSADAAEQHFADLKTKIDDTRGSLDTFNATQVPEKVAKMRVEGGERFNEAKRQYDEFSGAPDITKTITFRIQSIGEIGLTAALNAARQQQGLPLLPTAEGGVFNKPQVRLIAEAGDEAVVPLADARHDRARDVLAQAGIFERFAQDFAAHLTGAGVGVGAAPVAAARGAGGNTFIFNQNDTEAVARAVMARTGDLLAGG